MVRTWHITGSVLLAWLGLLLLKAVWEAPPTAGIRTVGDGGLQATGSVNYVNCRFGLGGDIGSYSITPLNIGWSMDWTAKQNPPRPNGADFLQVVRIKPAAGGYTFVPSTTTLQTILDQNPGSTWLIGNEPDSPWQDNLQPETYARAYHQLYYLIKQRDPSARVAAGNIVQPTPLRMQYLDRVLKTYQQLYSENLPADLWSIHSYILREIDPSDPEAAPLGPYEVWGAYIPPGITATRGMLYTYSQQYDVSIFRQRLLDFRAWMRDRGYRETPLYISEYGTLFPYVPYITPPDYQDEQGVFMTEARAAAFMTATFSVLRQLTDAGTGYPADANHLVQRWLWYSVSDPDFGGLLFDPWTHVRRPIGDAFASYTQAISPATDLLAVRLATDPPAVSYTGELVTVTLKGLIANAGNVSITSPITISIFSGMPGSGTLIGTRYITFSLAGCGASAEISLTWPNLNLGAHPVYMVAHADALAPDANPDNNTVTGLALVAGTHIYLPQIFRP